MMQSTQKASAVRQDVQGAPAGVAVRRSGGRVRLPIRWYSPVRPPPHRKLEVPALHHPFGTLSGILHPLREGRSRSRGGTRPDDGPQGGVHRASVFRAAAHPCGGRTPLRRSPVMLVAGRRAVHGRFPACALLFGEMMVMVLVLTVCLAHRDRDVIPGVLRGDRRGDPASPAPLRGVLFRFAEVR